MQSWDFNSIQLPLSSTTHQVSVRKTAIQSLPLWWIWWPHSITTVIFNKFCQHQQVKSWCSGARYRWNMSNTIPVQWLASNSPIRAALNGCINAVNVECRAAQGRFGWCHRDRNLDNGSMLTQDVVPWCQCHLGNELTFTGETIENH